MKCFEPDAHDDADWRELPDPHFSCWVWRCKNLSLQFRHVHGTIWHNQAALRKASMVQATPERKAMWRRLFLNPAL